MFKQILRENLEEWSEKLRDASNSIEELSNALGETELADRKEVVEFLNEWFSGFGINLCFDEYDEEIQIPYDTKSYISLDDVERECA